MLPRRPSSNSSKKLVRKIKILQIKRGEQKSFFSEYFLATLAVVFVVLSFLLMGFGLRFDESAVVALWIVGAIFVARQARRFFQGEREPSLARERDRKRAAESQAARPYKAPEVPRLSKDFSPEPPRGVKGYPPPSPFIKPPK